MPRDFLLVFVSPLISYSNIKAVIKISCQSKSKQKLSKEGGGGGGRELKKSSS